MTEDNKYNFRLRFNLPSRQNLNSNETELIITESGVSPVVILKVAEKDQESDRRKTFKEGRRLSLIGGPYESEADALEAAKVWRSTTETAFAYMGISADFGDRAPKGEFTKEGLQWLEESIGNGRRMLNDVHGTMVYESEPDPLFGISHIDVVQGIPADTTLDIMRVSHAKGLGNSLTEQLAYDLFSASFSQPAADARFLTLMMAIETLVNRQERSAAAIALVGDLTNAIRASGLDSSTIDSMSGAVRDLKYQSIGDACKDLARSLNGITYSGHAPNVFIKKCYGLRSALVHGQNPRPSREEVDLMAVTLEVFVGHLLSVKLGEAFRETSITSGSITAN